MKLLFVYNADSDFGDFVSGTVKKFVSPETQECNLCRLTYPLVAMDKKWKEFIGSLPHEAVFLHRDEFAKRYPLQKGVKLPAVFAEEPSGPRLVIPEEKISEAKNVSDLIEIVKRSLPGQAGGEIFYRCGACGLRYADERTAGECEAWCRAHKSCNLDIVKKALKENG